MIRLDNINKCFNKHLKNKNNVLQDVSFTLPDSGLIAIFGKSGSGKTTLLNIIGGLAKPDSGTITIGASKFKKVSDNLRNKEIGFIFQNYYLEKNYKISEIIENQMIISGISDKKIIEEETSKALEQVEMTRFKNKTGDSLSGGQQQRVAIARAIAKDAKIILADEPTGNLDSQNTAKVMQILKDISKTRLVVLVTHELNLIEEYADSYIELVDGKVVHNLESSKANEVEHSNSSPNKLVKTHKIGKLFNFKRIIKHLKFSTEDRFNSVATIFKQIFIIFFGAFLTFLAMKSFEINRSFAEDKPLNSNAVYTDVKAYEEIKNLDKKLYDKVNFFETNYRSGIFKLKVFDLISEISESYIPLPLEESITKENLVSGDIPSNNEVLVSTGLLKALKHKTPIKELKNDKIAKLLYFSNEYLVAGVIKNEDKIVYFKGADYLNFLKVYSKIAFNDVNELFFKGSYKAKSYYSKIHETDQGLANDEAILEINRNSLYRLLDNYKEADIICESTNIALLNSPKLIQINDSKLYIKKIKIIKSAMKNDVNILVNKEVISNIFVYIKPNINAIENNNLKYNDYFFEIISKDKTKLAKHFSDNYISSVDVLGLYNQRLSESKSKAFGEIQILLLGVLLLFFIYYFFAKADSIKNNKEYGIYRAIGVKKSNLLFKELVAQSLTNLTTFTITYLISSCFISSYYLISNISILMLFLYLVGVYFISIIVLMFISIIPYLFVIYLMPSDILAKYDI